MQCASSARRLAAGTIFLHVLFSIFDDSFLSFFFSSACSPFHRVIVIGGISLHSEVMNAVCQIAHARAADAATIAASVPSDGRASPSAAPAFNFTSSSIPAIACISTTIHSHMARALFWDSEFRCCLLCLKLSSTLSIYVYNSAVRDAVACDRCVPVDALRVTFDNRFVCVTRASVVFDSFSFAAAGIL